MALCWHRLPGRRRLISGRWTAFFFFSSHILVISSDTNILITSNQSKIFSFTGAGAGFETSVIWLKLRSTE